MAKLLSGFLNTSFSTFDSGEVIQLIAGGAGTVLGTNTNGDYIESALGGSGIIITNSSTPEGANITFAIDSSVVATLTKTQTLTNKSINLTNNTLTGNAAEFNAALSGDNFVTETASQTITNKTLTAPIIGSTGASFTGSSSGGINVIATAIAGSNTLTLPAVTGVLVTEANTTTLTNKTISGANNTLSNIANASTTATNANTSSAIVARDASGNFTAGTITASGEVISGNGVSTYGPTTSGMYLRIGGDTWASVVSGTKMSTIFSSSGNLHIDAQDSNAAVYLNFYGGTGGVHFGTGGTASAANVNSAGLFSGTATSARYADLAEKYLADDNYDIGTVVCVGGEAEVTASTPQLAHSIVGVVSEHPAHLMNGELEGGTAIALRGRVPVRVTGNINKGDRLTVSDIPGCAKANNDAKWTFAIALHSSDDTGIVEAIIL
jgi:hypothetical protein